LTCHTSESCAAKRKKKVIEALKGRIYREPSSGKWLAADEYLSGNVVEKLREAKAAAALDDNYRRTWPHLKA